MNFSIKRESNCFNEYDYENRIVKITKDPNNTAVAEFSYDTLGRRIEKKDCITASKTRRYYYNTNWQILAKYNGADKSINSYIIILSILNSVHNFVLSIIFW